MVQPQLPPHSVPTMQEGTMPLAQEDRRRALRYTAGAVVFVGVLLAIYHVTSQRSGMLTGLLAPAAIMVLYLLWVLYTARNTRHAAALRLATVSVPPTTTITQHNGLSCVQTQTPGSQETLRPHPRVVAGHTEPRSLSRSSSRLKLSGDLDSTSEVPSKTLSNRVRHSGTTLHRSSDSLHRLASPLNGPPPAVHRSTVNLGPRGSGRAGATGGGHGGSRMMLNNSRQVAAAVASLPSYAEATSRSHWLTHKHSRERLLHKP